MKFKYICFYRENCDEPTSWKDNPKTKIINAKSKEEAARKFEKNFPNCRLVLVDKAFSIGSL